MRGRAVSAAAGRGVGPGEVPAGEAGEGVAGQARGGEEQGPQQGEQANTSFIVLSLLRLDTVDCIALICHISAQSTS